MSAVRVLIVEDEELLRTGLVEFFKVNDYAVAEAATLESARARFAAFQPDVVLVDYLLTDGTALDLIPEFQSASPSVPIVVMTGHGTIDLAVAAVKLGADQFLTKPIEFDALRLVIERTLDNQRNRNRLAAAASSSRSEAFDPFLGESRAIRTLAADARKVADADTPVLILGATGAGKGVLARWLHENSRRAREPFVDANCAAFAPELLDTELFGHERGAFTGAVATKQGLVEVAHRGVLFLDEIGDMSLQLQPKLLKVIEEQRFRRIGSTRPRIVDVRMIAATNRDLAAAVAAGQFRSDLYYRISMIPLVIPPLRDRPEDVLPLARSILARIAPRYHHKAVTLTASAESALLDYQWPGNLRELRNVLERAVLLAGRDVVDAGDLRLPESDAARGTGDASSAKWSLLEAERRHIETVLRANADSMTRAARVLGISRSAFYDKLKKHNIKLPASERLAAARGEASEAHRGAARARGA